MEGSELDVLAGAGHTLRRDRPVFTVEVALRDAKSNAKLLEVLATLGYRAHVVNELCGYNADCRNLICFPLERTPTPPLLEGTTELASVAALESVYRLLPRGFHKMIVRHTEQEHRRAKDRSYELSVQRLQR